MLYCRCNSFLSSLILRGAKKSGFIDFRPLAIGSYKHSRILLFLDHGGFRRDDDVPLFSDLPVFKKESLLQVVWKLTPFVYDVVVVNICTSTPLQIEIESLF